MASPAIKNKPPSPRGKITSPEVIDLLAITPSKVSFALRVQDLGLSKALQQKVLEQEERLLWCRPGEKNNTLYLSLADEKELATEMLLLRHRFTELVFNSGKFRQAALSIIQNIYLFQNRKIFFGSTDALSGEQERQQALDLFSGGPGERSLPLAKTFQHLILARVWNRIVGQATESALQEGGQFIEIQKIVEKLNTIRNIYILLTTGLVRKLAARINAMYKESVTFEDAVQIGSFGVARAAYRYHQSTGIRFSTYAANWVFKEIQRQSLQGRLIRVSTNSVEKYSRAAKSGQTADIEKYLNRLEQATTVGEDNFSGDVSTPSYASPPDLQQPTADLEAREMRAILLQAIDLLLSDKSADIIRRRYGFPPYQDQEQSVIAISRVYGVTRSSVYQMEQTALQRLHRHLHEASS